MEKSWSCQLRLRLFLGTSPQAAAAVDWHKEEQKLSFPALPNQDQWQRRGRLMDVKTSIWAQEPEQARKVSFCLKANGTYLGFLCTEGPFNKWLLN